MGSNTTRKDFIMKKTIVLFVILCLAAIVETNAQSSQPYSHWYGNNHQYDNYTPHSTITITAPGSSDVVVIVKRGNQYGKVAGHRYITRGGTASIDLPNGTYQVFFYYGSSWSSQKSMGSVRGGFTRDEVFSKDNPVILYNNVLTYELVLQRNGNFSTKHSNKNEIF